MDSQKLYKWEEERKQEEIEVQDNNIILEEEKHQSIEEKDNEPLSALDKQRNRVKSTMPSGISILAGKHSLLSSGRYKYFDKKGREHNASRRTPSSKYMRPIVASLETIDNLLSRPFSFNDEAAIQKSFFDAIKACENYLDNRNPWTAEGIARKQMVRDFYAQLKSESVLLSGRVSELGSSGNIDKITWKDVLKKTRMADYTDGQKGVKITIGGAGTSNLYVIEKEGKKKYFKENEKLEKLSFKKLVDKTTKSLKKSDKDYKRRIKCLNLISTYYYSKYDYKTKRIVDSLKDAISGENALNSIMRDTKGELHDLIKSINEDHNRLEDEINLKKAQFIKLSKESEEYTKLEQSIKDMELQLKDSDKSFLAEELLRYKKVYTSDSIASKVAKIETYEDLSKRNVATSRMAKLLGIEDMIAKSDMATVTINGKTMTGTIMEEVKGTIVEDSKTKAAGEETSVKYSPEAFKQLMNLQVFDVICGQVDRHTGNYLGELEKKKDGRYIFKNIKGIDNDMSFGLIKYSDILKNGQYGIKEMKPIELDGTLTIPFLDYDMAMKIKALKPAEVSYQMADILSKEEIRALIDRIKGVQNVINRQLALDEKNKNKNNGYKSRFVKDSGDGKEWESALNKYKKSLVGIKKKEGDNIAEEFVKKTSYLKMNLV